jgi:hypothetical protein
MSEPSEHGHDYPGVLPRVEVASGLVVSPGDVLVLAVRDATTIEDLHEVTWRLRSSLPGVRVVLVGGDVQMSVMKPAGLDVPARPLVELPTDGTEHTVTLDADPLGGGWLPPAAEYEARLAAAPETARSVDEFLEHSETGGVRTRPERRSDDAPSF